MTNQEQERVVRGFQSVTKTSQYPTSILHLQRHTYPAIGRPQPSSPPPALEAFEHLFFPARAAPGPMTILPPMPAMLASFVQLRLVNCSDSASDATLTDAGRCPNPTINPNEVHLPRGPGYNDIHQRTAGRVCGREYPATSASGRVSEVEGSLIYQSNAVQCGM